MLALEFGRGDRFLFRPDLLQQGSVIGSERIGILLHELRSNASLNRRLQRRRRAQVCLGIKFLEKRHGSSHSTWSVRGRSQNGIASEVDSCRVLVSLSPSSPPRPLRRTRDSRFHTHLHRFSSPALQAGNQGLNPTQRALPPFTTSCVWKYARIAQKSQVPTPHAPA